MHKIYFEKRCIIICHEGESALSDPNAVEFRFGESVSIHSLVAMFKAGESLGKVYIPTDDTEWMYRRVCAEFKEVEAAGGLVSNRRGDLLLINRNGLWDLPKGHREKGESISTTALREVSEETGIDKLELRSLICVTDHCYLRDGIWHLKHTWWYDMYYDAPLDLSPQREEDIAKAAWIARSGVAAFVKNSYPSIAEVFREAKI